jgi:hypothetical protein
VIIDLMMDEKVAIMKGSVVNQIVQATIALLGPLVHGKIFNKLEFMHPHLSRFY